MALCNFYTPSERSSGVYIGITVLPSVRLFMQIHVQTITFFRFDIGLPYLAYGCITMRQCVSHIHDLCMILTFNLNIKIIIFTINLSPTRSSVPSDMGIPILGNWYGCITVRHVLYILDLCMTLTYIWLVGSILVEFYSFLTFLQ